MSELEERVDALEKEPARIRQKVDRKSKLPWWERIAGSFYDDNPYEEAMKLGSDYRRSASSDTMTDSAE